MPQSSSASGDRVFVFDEAKSAANKAKHGIDFVEAQELWEDEGYWEYPARDVGEERYLCVGVIGEKHWSAVITYRGGTVRIISVRRARSMEVRLYEGR